jgi:hypothetical protein
MSDFTWEYIDSHDLWETSFDGDLMFTGLIRTTQEGYEWFLQSWDAFAISNEDTILASGVTEALEEAKSAAEEAYDYMLEGLENGLG